MRLIYIFSYGLRSNAPQVTEGQRELLLECLSNTFEVIVISCSPSDTNTNGIRFVCSQVRELSHPGDNLTLQGVLWDELVGTSFILHETAESFALDITSSIDGLTRLCLEDCALWRTWISTSVSDLQGESGVINFNALIALIQTLAIQSSNRKCPNRPLLLALNDYDPFVGNAGGAIRLRALYSAYEEFFDVVVLCFSVASVAERVQHSSGIFCLKMPKTVAQLKDEKALSVHGAFSINDVVAVAHAGKNRLLSSLYRHLSACSRLTVLDHPYMAALPFIYGNRFVYSSHNVESQLKESLLRGHPYRDDLLKVVCWAEAFAVSAAECVFAVSDSDIEQFSQNKACCAQLMKIQNGAPKQVHVSPAVRDQARRGCGEASLIFIGSGHTPNVDAARWIAMDLARELSEFEIHILGGARAHISREDVPKNVVLWDEVDSDLKTALFDLALLALNPMVSGGGSNIKLADYLSHGLHVISTPFGARGYEDIPVEDLSISMSSVTEFANIVRAAASAGWGARTSKDARRHLYRDIMSMSTHAKIAAETLFNLVK